MLPMVIGHRGDKSTAPENTLASVTAAKAAGCTWVEVDVMLTKDKIPVIHHDNKLDRCTNGQGNLWEHNIEAIELLDAGSHFSADAAGERIPRLEALLLHCRELSLGINLEVKHVTEHSNDVPTAEETAMEEEIADVTCDTIERLHVQPADLIFSSFSRCAIAVLRRRLPHFRCAFLVEDIPDDWEDFVTTHQCASLNFECHNPANTRHRIQQCARKVPCYSYTVNDGEMAHQLLNDGVLGVFSDCPRALSEALLKHGRVACTTAVVQAPLPLVC